MVVARVSFSTFVLDQLQALRGLTHRAMFGGHGLYMGEIFFGILYRGRLYLWTSAATRVAYVERGAKPFRPRVGGRSMTMQHYYEVPADVLDDADTLTDWARAAVTARRASHG